MIQRIGLLIFVAVLSCPLTVSALEYVLRPSIAVQERYDDNIFLTSSNRTSDFITSVAPVFDLAARGEKMELALNYSPLLNWFASHGDRNNIAHSAFAKARFNIAEELTLNFGDIFVRTEDSGTVRALENAGPVRRGTNRFTNNTMNAAIDWQATAKLTFILDGVYSNSKNSSSTDADVKTVSSGLATRFRLTERTTLIATTRATFFEYRASGNARSQDLLLGASHQFTPTFSVEALGGVGRTTSDRTDRTTNGFRAGVTLNKKLERGNVSLSYQQAVIAGVESGSPVSSKVFAFRYSHRLTPLFDANLGASYGLFKSVEASAQDRRDLSGSLELTYRLTPRLSIFTIYSCIDSKDKFNDQGSFRNNQLLAGLRISLEARY